MDRQTLLPIIQREVARETITHSDEWPAPAYGTLDQDGYIHLTVNHQEIFVDLARGANTQTTECFRGHLEQNILRNMKGTTYEMLPCHVAELWWHSMNSGVKFLTILKDIRRMFVRI